MAKNKYFFPYKDKIYWGYLTEDEFKSTGIKSHGDEITEEQFKIINKILQSNQIKPFDLNDYSESIEDFFI